MNEKFAYLDARKLFVENIKNDIIEGNAFWMKPWNTDIVNFPVNGIYNRPYNGVNLAYLMFSGHKDCRWYTEKQASKKGYILKSDAEPVVIEYWNRIYNKDQQTVFPFCKLHQVYNAEDFENVPELIVENWNKSPEDIDPVIEKIIAKFSSMLITDDDIVNASYSINSDKIIMPSRMRFVNNAEYYATYLHEIAHSTMHKSRLNRKVDRQSLDELSKEELRVEIASAFIMLKSHIIVSKEYINERSAKSAGYVKSWIEGLSGKNYGTFFSIIKDAQKICDYVLSFGKEN